jgi:hypothetical protein
MAPEPEGGCEQQRDHRRNAVLAPEQARRERAGHRTEAQPEGQPGGEDGGTEHGRRDQMMKLCRVQAPSREKVRDDSTERARS